MEITIGRLKVTFDSPIGKLVFSMGNGFIAELVESLINEEREKIYELAGEIFDRIREAVEEIKYHLKRFSGHTINSLSLVIDINLLNSMECLQVFEYTIAGIKDALTKNETSSRENMKILMSNLVNALEQCVKMEYLTT